MARRWTVQEERRYRAELQRLYIDENKSITEIAPLLKLTDKGVYCRLVRLGISTIADQKGSYCNQRTDINLPLKSPELAEFLGIMLGDGCLTRFQVMVTLGSKEYEYVLYVQKLMRALFGAPATIMTSKLTGHHVVYIGSTKISSWLQGMGLAFNKVKAQVEPPDWIYADRVYMQRFLRGFFDTDGSIYKLRFGVQLSFTNHSTPLLLALQRMLKSLGYRVSAVTAFRIYITKREEVIRFFGEISPKNPKHCRRFDRFMRRWWSGKHTTL